METDHTNALLTIVKPPHNVTKGEIFFFQAEDGIRDIHSDWSSDVCSSDLLKALASAADGDDDDDGSGDADGDDEAGADDEAAAASPKRVAALSPVKRKPPAKPKPSIEDQQRAARIEAAEKRRDRQRVVWGKSVDLGGCRSLHNESVR